MAASILLRNRCPRDLVASLKQPWARIVCQAQHDLPDSCCCTLRAYYSISQGWAPSASCDKKALRKKCTRDRRFQEWTNRKLSGARQLGRLRRLETSTHAYVKSLCHAQADLVMMGWLRAWELNPQSQAWVLREVGPALEVSPTLYPLP